MAHDLMHAVVKSGKDGAQHLCVQMARINQAVKKCRAPQSSPANLASGEGAQESQDPKLDSAATKQAPVKKLRDRVEGAQHGFCKLQQGPA
jgi:hypothetical protein